MCLGGQRGSGGGGGGGGTWGGDVGYTTVRSLLTTIRGC